MADEQQKPSTTNQPVLDEIDTDAEVPPPGRSKYWIVIALLAVAFLLFVVLEHAGPLHGILRGIHGGGGH